MTADTGEADAAGPEPRLRGAIELLVRQAGARVGFVLDAGGHVTVAAGRVDGLDPVGLAALASAQAWAARDLAPMLAGVEFSHLFQRGRDTAVALHALDDDHLVALLYRYPEHEGRQAECKVLDVTEISRAAAELAGWNAEVRADPGRRDAGWARVAEDRIEQVFGGEG